MNVEELYILLESVVVELFDLCCVVKFLLKYRNVEVNIVGVYEISVLMFVKIILVLIRVRVIIYIYEI